MLIAAILIGSCCVILAIPTTIAAIRSVRKSAKITYAAISTLLVGFAAVLVVLSLLRAPLDFTAPAPVPASLTMYFTQNDLGSSTDLHADLRALRVTDGATIFDHSIPTHAAESTFGIDLLSNGILYTEVSTETNSTRTVVLSAQRPGDGSVIWQRSLPGVPGHLEIYPAPAHLFSHDDVLYFDIVDFNFKESVYALNMRDGSTIWQQPVSDQNSSGGAIFGYDNGMIYLNSLARDHRLYALRASDGKEIWHSTPLLRDFDPVSVVAGNVYVIDPTATIGGQEILYALQGDTGAALWQVPDVTNFTAVNATVYLLRRPGALVALRATDGTPLWQATGTYELSLGNGIPIADDVAYVHGGTNGSNSNTIFAYRVTDGTLLWSHVDNTLGVENFEVTAGMLYYSDGGVLTALRVSDGSVFWQHHNTDIHTSFGAPTVVDGVVIVSSQSVRSICLFACSTSNYIYVLNATTGAVYWRYQANVDTDIPIFVNAA